MWCPKSFQHSAKFVSAQTLVNQGKKYNVTHNYVGKRGEESLKPKMKGFKPGFMSDLRVCCFP